MTLFKINKIQSLSSQLMFGKVAKLIYYVKEVGHSLSRENKYLYSARCVNVFGAYEVNLVNFFECASI